VSESNKLHPLVKCKICKIKGYAYCVHVEHKFQTSTSCNNHTNKRPNSASKKLKGKKQLSNANLSLGKNERKLGSKKKVYLDHSKNVEEKLIKSLKRRKMNRKCRRRILRSLGLKKKGNLNTAANVKARVKLQQVLSKKVVSRFEEDMEDYEFFHITVCDDRFMTLERSPYLDLDKIKQVTRDIMKYEPDLKYIGMMDVCLLTNFPANELGSSMGFHFHILAWRLKTKSNKKSKLPFSKLQLKSIRCTLLKKAIKVQRVRSGTLKQMSLYVFKPPYWGKTVRAAGFEKPRIKLANRPIPDNAMRFLMCARVLSYLNLGELFIASQEERKIVNSALKKVSIKFGPKFRLRTSLHCREESWECLSKAWENAQKSRVRLDYREPAIRIRSNDPPIEISNSWIKKYADRLLDKASQQKPGEYRL